MRVESGGTGTNHDESVAFTARSLASMIINAWHRSKLDPIDLAPTIDELAYAYDGVFTRC